MEHNFPALVKEFTPAVYRQSYGMLGNQADAEEAVQDVFMVVFRKLDSFRGESALSTWIYTITFRICLRRRAGKKQWFTSLNDDTDFAGTLPDPDPDPEALSMSQESNEALAAGIARLPVHEAAAITLFYLDEQSYEQIGEILGMPPGTVATTLHRARRRLRAIIEKTLQD